MAATLFQLDSEGNLTLRDGGYVFAAQGVTISRYICPSADDAACAVYTLALAPGARVHVPVLHADLLGLLHIQAGTLALQCVDRFLTLGKDNMAILPTHADCNGWNPTADTMRGLIFVSIRGNVRQYAEWRIGP